MRRAVSKEPMSEVYHSPVQGELTEQQRQGFLGNHRRVRTSAAMLGLALSMGASGVLIPDGNDAAAAELPTSMTLAMLPVQGSVGSIGSIQSTTYHTVRDGETLWQIAQVHHADIQAIKAANGISSDDAVLQVGQVLKVPVVTHRQTLQASQPSETIVAERVSEAVPSVLARAESAQAPAKSETVDKPSSASAEVKPEGSSTASEAQESPEIRISSSDSEPVQSPASIVVASVPSTPVFSTPATDASALGETVELGADPENFVAAVEDAAQPEADDTIQAEGDTIQTEDAGNRVARSDSQSVSGHQVSPQAEGFPNLPIARNSPPTDTVSSVGEPIEPVVSSSTYVVEPGDTLALIAQRNDVSLAELVRVNNLRNPNWIVAGDTLTIPRSSQLVASAASSENDGIAPANQNLSALVDRARQSSASPNSDIKDLLRTIRERRSGEIQSSEAETGDHSVSARVDQSSSQTTDPYVTKLLERVEAIRQSRSEALATSTPTIPQGVPASESEIATSPSLVSTVDISTQPEETPQLGSSEPVAVNPEFTSRSIRRTTAVTTPLTPSDSSVIVPDDGQLMAAASLGSEAYAPLSESPAGQVVSPNMPALPDANEYLPDAPNRFNGYIWPTTGVLTSGYGWRWGRMHRGVDIAGPVGTPVMAAAPGVVVTSGWNSGGYGNLVDIRHADGSLTRYAHNSRLLVRPGQQVAQGQQIAEMGSTGYSTGPHLHFEVHLPDQGTVNPIAYLPGR